MRDGRRFRVADGFDGPYLIELENFAGYGGRWARHETDMQVAARVLARRAARKHQP